ncbi:MAG: hypothetical protein AAGJ35_04425 [Myxococcota bacterium]
MIEIHIQIEIKNHEELAKQRAGGLLTGLARFAKVDLKHKVETEVAKEVSERVSKELQQQMEIEGVHTQMNITHVVHPSK